MIACAAEAVLLDPVYLGLILMLLLSAVMVWVLPLQLARRANAGRAGEGL